MTKKRKEPEVHKKLEDTGKVDFLSFFLSPYFDRFFLFKRKLKK